MQLLHRLKASAAPLRNEALPFVGLKNGVLILDDSTLDKLYAQHIEPVCRHWSGKHHSVVKGINLLTLLWTDGDTHIPCDYRIYHKTQDGKTKNGHFADLLYKAKIRGFEPSCVLFDSWYSGLNNLKIIRTYGWHWLTRLKPNRMVNPDGKGNVPLSSAVISEAGTSVHLRLFIKKNIPNQTNSFGLIKISHLGKTGFLNRNFSTERIAAFVSEIPFLYLFLLIFTKG